MVQIEYNYIKNVDSNIINHLNKTIVAYKHRYNEIRIGISDENVQSLVTENTDGNWRKISILYKINTFYMFNIIEFWLIDEHWDIFADKNFSENFELILENKKYLYILSA